MAVNLFPNTSAEDGTAPWVAQGTTTLAAVADATAPHGANVFKITQGSAGASRLVLSPGTLTFAAAETFTLSLYVKADASNSGATPDVRMTVRDSVAADTWGDILQAPPPLGEWVRYQATFTVPAGRVGDYFYLGFNVGTAGDIFYVDAVQAEYGSAATGFGGTVTFDLLDVNGTLVAADLADTSQAGWSEGRFRFGFGQGSLTITNDHPQWEAATLTPLRLIRCNIAGTAVFTWVIRDVGYQRVGDHPEQVTVLSGPGVGALLGGDGVAGAVVEGYGTSKIRVFGWPAPYWDDSAWTAAVSAGTWQTPTWSPLRAGDPQDWPLTVAGAANVGRVTYTAPVADGAGGFVHPSRQVWYHRRDLDLGAVVGEIRVYWNVGNYGRGWWSGEDRATLQAHSRAMGTFTVSGGGQEVLAFEVTNGTGKIDAGGDYGNLENTTDLMYVGVTVSDDGELGDIVFQSGGGLGVCTTTPELVTAGHVVTRLLGTTQADGFLDGISCTATDDLDSTKPTAKAFVEERLLVSYRADDAYGAVMRGIEEDFSVAMRMAPDLELLLLESPGAAVGLEVDVADAMVKVSPPDGNVARVRTSEEVAWVSDASRIAAEGVKRAVSMEFGTARYASEVVDRAEATLARAAGKATQQVTTYGQTLDAYLDVDLFDTAQLPLVGGGLAVGHTVEAVSVEVEDDNRERIYIFDVEHLL